MIWSNLCDYRDAYILVSEAIAIDGEGHDDAAKLLDEKNKEAIFKNLFTEYISNTNYTKIDNPRDIDVMMLMYNLTECSDNYSETSRSLWQRYRDDPNDNKKIWIIQILDLNNRKIPRWW